MISYTVELDGDTLKTPGVNTGKPLKVLHRAGYYLLVRRAGHTYREDRWSSRHVQTRYMLCTLNQEHVSNPIAGKPFDRDFIIVVEERHPGTSWKKAEVEMRAECDRLAAIASKEPKRHK